MGNHAYGWIKQSVDERDVKLTRPVALKTDLPPSVDLRPQMPPPYDQGQLGSCSANAIAAAVEYYCIKTDYKWKFTPSRLFMYYNERALEGTIDQDAGAELRDGLKSLNLNGICPETEGDGTKPDWLWPYSDGPDLFKQKPPEACYKDSVLHEALKYEAVPPNAAAVMTVLAAGIPIIFGIPVYSSFESASVAACGVVPLPSSRDQLQGGHAVLAVGYFNKLPPTVLAAAKKARRTVAGGAYVLVRNSWGSDWGDGGYFYLPLSAYMCKLGDDFWALEAVGFQK